MLRGIIVICAVLATSNSAFAEKLISNGVAECGSVLEGEFVETAEGHKYEVRLAPGDSLDIKIAPIGDYLGTYLQVLEPLGGVIEQKHSTPPGHVSIKTKTLSGRGNYQIIVRNYRPGHHGAGRGGAYSLFLTCNLRDGSVISP